MLSGRLHMQKLNKRFTDEELFQILTSNDKNLINNLKKEAREASKKIYGNKIYIRGLIEFSNYCSQSCFYCGINKKNTGVKRFRLKKSEIMAAARFGYEKGFRTFVLQGGEDCFFTDDIFVDLIMDLKEKYPDCAVTLSIGVKSKKSYEKFKKAGADRFLLRFESADLNTFFTLHPKNQSLENRITALKNLRELKYTIGTGFLIGAPGCSIESHIKDIKLIRKIEPEMIGVGPFIPHKDTKFKNYPQGALDLSLRVLSILRLEHNNALIPATTALNTIDKNGRILGILSGANVLMPNLSPESAKKNYNLYDNKNCYGLESAEDLDSLNNFLKNYGYEIEITRGDYKYGNK